MSDEVASGKPYGVDQFAKDLDSIGTTVKPNDDESEAYTIRDHHLGITTTKVNTPISVEVMQPGDQFSRYGIVVEPLNNKGILITEDSYGDRYLIKVLNLDSKPSLYRGELAF